MAATVEKLFDALFGCRAVRHVHEVCKRALAETDALAASSFLFTLLFIERSARFHKNGEGRKKTFRVPYGDYHRRRFARVDVIGKTRRDYQIPQACASRSPRNEKSRSQKREEKEEKVVARIPRGEGYD